ncbi:uncharacterized protein DS421_7g217760 [Arachis hypogaea]|nr:uncharacterized protein DS421_7g217760 [Arachis hypogaea]
MKMRMTMAFEIIPPQKVLFHIDIEACPTLYWIQYIPSFIFLSILLRQIIKALACPKQLLPQCLRHPMIDKLQY